MHLHGILVFLEKMGIFAGITAVGHFNCEMRTLLNGSGITSTQRAETKSSEMDDNLLSMVTFYPNLKANLKVPYFDENTCQWKEEGYSISENTDTLTSKYLTPHRLTTKIDFSVSILRQSGKFYEEVNDILIKAIYTSVRDKIRTMTVVLYTQFYIPV